MNVTIEADTNITALHNHRRIRSHMKPTCVMCGGPAEYLGPDVLLDEISCTSCMEEEEREFRANQATYREAVA